MDTSALAKRMKKYEAVSKNMLMRRTPVIIRVDGRAFHTFTKGFQKPFDEVLMSAMQDTMKYLCENIQGCVLGYTQSDEITLVLTDYKRLESDAWFDYKVQMLGQAYFSHKELQHKTCNQIQDMLMTQKEINWNDLPSHQKRGSCCVKNRRIVSISADRTETCELRDSSESENAWVIDKEIPIFKGEGRLYIDELILLEV